MSKEGVVSFVEKALSNQAFQSQLKENPEAALNQFDLTDGEREAIRSGSEEDLKAMGLDTRLSKTVFFGLGGGESGGEGGGEGGDAGGGGEGGDAGGGDGADGDF